MLPEQIIYVGIFVNIVCSLWYIKSVIWGNTKPNLISWFMWSLAPLVIFFLQIKAGAGLSASGAFIGGFFPLITFTILLFKKDYYFKISLFDIFCGSLSILALILYVATNSLGVSIVFAILSDALAYLPTLRKSWNFPESESSSTYFGGIVNNTLALLIIKNWVFPIYSFPIYVVIANLIVVYFIYRKKIFKS